MGNIWVRWLPLLLLISRGAATEAPKMKYLDGLVSYLSSTSALVAAKENNCKCTPDGSCWPSTAEWSSFNETISGHLIRSIPPASVCYPSQPNYNEEQCAIVRSQWFNSTWHAQDPISVDYPIWTNNSCNPIDANGTSITGDTNAGKKGCSIGNYPVYAVNAKNAGDVSTAFRWAAKKNIRVVVKSTGHSYPGRSVGYGSLSIWTHNLRGLDYIEWFKPRNCPIEKPLRAARIAAGHTGFEAQAELAKRNMVVVTGANPDVGVVGWLTGGGHGTLSTSYGMGADNLLEATIVTPDGKLLVTNPCKNPDVFFAIRGGGGGTFGVVLEIVVKAFPSPQTSLNVFKLASLSPTITTEFWDLMGFIHAEMPKLKEGGMQGYYYMVGPPTTPTLSFFWGFFLYNKSNGTVERLMAPIEDYLKIRPTLFAYQSNITQSPSYFPLYAGTFTNEQVANGGSAFGSRLLSPESLSDPNVTARVFEQIGPSSLKKNGVFDNPGVLGHMIASPKEPSYYPEVISMNPGWRDTLTHLLVVEGWRDGIAPELIRSVYQDITYNKTEPLRKLSPDTGAYFNECDSYEPQWQKAFWGKHYARLRKIKQKYDPKNLLWCRRCVGSEALVEREDGRLCKANYGTKRDGTASFEEMV
ncbi:hypothetical protein BDV96DRAFT_571629 [Lophiotrema nucula]|uniref:FAD-binding PCMH-type domain-containing protein n=1 Tax=Lophiotrema nucula TaxID=690887 RepID=A0A6A5ZCD1_9PLEO|nr:hypothetical protein BDV96DRAFT_571629 [Lophiotrema nucula]